MHYTLFPANKPTPATQMGLAQNPAIEKTIPTTEAQKEIWLACELGGEKAGLSYNQSYTLQFTGKLHVEALHTSLELLIARHEALRSNFSIDGQHAYIAEHLPVTLEKIDLSNLTPEAQNKEFAHFLRMDSLQEFNLHDGSLFRFKLHIFSTVESRLTFTLHHIIGDGWSIHVILKDLSTIYSTLVQNQELALPAPPQISDYVADEINYKKSDSFRTTEKFWIKRFEKNLPVFTLPTDFPRKTYRTYESARVDLTIEHHLIESLKQFGIQHQCSLPTVLISVFEIFLHEITFQKNIILGLPTSGQVGQEKYGLVGHCANLLPLISEIELSETYLAYLKKRRSDLFDAYEHQNFTFGELIKKVQITRDHSRATLVPVVLNIDTSAGHQASFKDLAHHVVSNPKSHEVFEIFLNITHKKEETLFEWTFNTNLFLEETIRKYHHIYLTLLERIVTNPMLSIGEIVHRDADLFISKPVETTLNQLIYSTTEKFRHHTAVSFNATSLTYHELNTASNQFANYLLNKGVQTGDMVGISCFRSIETLIALLGIIKAGACYVPIDSSLPPERKNYIIQNANIKLLFTEQWLNMHLEASKSFDSNNLTIHSASNDPVYVLHTSGSTGVPKGVSMGNEALVNLLLWQLENSSMSALSKTLQYSALSFDVSFQEIFATLLSGGELVLIDDDKRRDPKELLDYIDTQQVNRLFMPFVALQALADTAISSNLYPASLRELITAGEQLKVTEHIRRFFNQLPKCTLSNQYGPTECHVVSALTLQGNPDTWAHIPSIGKEIYNTRIYILTENLQEVDPGETGELCISGLSLADGYLNQPEITSSKFITFVDNRGEHIRIYKTGDLARRLPNNEIEFLGRKDFQVKIRGYRVELGEIEHHLVAQPAIKDAIVIPFQKTPGDLQLVAYLIKNNQAIDTKLIKRSLQDFLPEYMIPHQYIELEKFPKTLSGKIDRKSLPQPEPVKTAVNNQHDSQSLTSLQQKVITVWSHFLHSDQLTLKSNFFEEGGHSLTAINVLIRLEKETGLRPKLTSLFKYPRLEDFASLYEPSLTSGENNLKSHATQPEKTDNQSLIEISILETQSEIWISSILGGDSSNKSYNISSAHLLNGELNIAHFTKALELIVNRHESLRTTFNDDGSQMQIHAKLPVEVYHQDLSPLTEVDKDHEIKRYSLEVSEAPFNLSQGHLFRFSLLKLSDNSHYFIFTAHHLICDGYSMNVILKELSILYNTLLEHQPSNLSTAPLLRDYATQKHQFYESENYRKIKNYWLSQIPTNSLPLRLPYDFEPSTTKDYSGAYIHATLPNSLIKTIQSFNSRHQSSFSLTIKVLFELFVYHLSKQTEFIIGQLSADQIYNGYDGLVGNCVNLLPLPCRIDPMQSFIQHFEDRKTELIEFSNHQSITFGTLVKEMNLKQNPLSSEFISVVINTMVGIQEDFKLNNLRSEPYNFDSGTEKFNLTLNIYGTEDAPLFEWNYRSQVFKKETIMSFIRDFEKTIGQLLAEPESAIDSSQSSVPNQHHSILTTFQAIAASYPDTIAVRSTSSELTYQELDKESNRLANYLIFRGVKKGDIIAMAVDRDAELLTTLLGILKSGAAYLPLDPEYPVERLQFMLEDSKCKFSIIKDELNVSTPAVNLFDDFNSSILNNFSSQPPNVAVDAHDLAYVLYTSGSTGNPKGVEIEHNSLSNCLTSFQAEPGLTVEDVFLAITTISFDIAAIELFLPLITGATVFIADSDVIKDTRELLALLTSEKIDVVQATPTTWKMLLQSDWDQALPIKALCGGEPLSLDLAQRLLKKTHELWNVYGPTETTIWSSVKKIHAEDQVITIGHPINNTEIYILNPNLQKLAPGESGEIYIGGDGVARGYLNRQALTAEKFIPNPFDNNSRIYATGDMGYFIENGEIVCLGRQDTQIKIRGHRIEVEEIESKLNKEEDVKDSIIICDDTQADNQLLIAYIILKEKLNDSSAPYIQASEAQVSRWKQRLSEQLPSYMTPSFYLLVSDFPRTENGKIDRKKLPRLHYDGLNKPMNVELISEEERAICAIWSEVLGYKNITVSNNFFDLGGNSLMAVRVMLRIEKQFSIKLPINILYTRPTVQELASEIKQHEPKKPWNLIIPIKTTGNKRPLYMIHGLGLNVLNFEPLRKYMNDDQPIYALQALGLNGDLNAIPNNMNEMAAIYAQEIIQHDPLGPYNIAGYSSGGSLAHEVARQILMAGKSISKLVIIDTQICGSQKSPHEFIFSRRRFSKLKFIARSFVLHPLKASRHHFIKMANKLNLSNDRSPFHDIPDEVENKELLTIHYELFVNHQPQPIETSINLIKGKERVHFLNDGKTYGWNQFTSDQVVISETPGDHFTCFNEPHVKALATRLQTILDS